MLVSTTDPITGTAIADTENHPYLVEGKGRYALKIYFENEGTKQRYLDVDAKHPAKDFTIQLNHPVSMGG